MWEAAARQTLLAFAGISAGIASAGGLFAFIVELGVVADFADRTHTGDHILFYEDCAALGGIFGSLVYIFRFPVPLGQLGLGVVGLFSGIFVGCWAMALSEILNVFPVFLRRARMVRYLAAFTISIAVGKGAGAALFFMEGW
ncbi:MAG TPA: stage V sporulation protein AB [Candidatus Mediterraneibacter merdipullorum]|nr:stage V sporulation protein AB [Candidatus Mediterraneibacter merdipullorum]